MLVVHMQLDAAARSYFQRCPVDRAPPAYRPRLARKTHPAALGQSMAGLWLLEKALEHAGNNADWRAEIRFDARGRPSLPGGPAFSISHSRGFAACAVTDTPDGATRVGLDVETHRAIAGARLARLAGNDAERAVIARQPARFFDYWCAREATVKASGRVGLQRIRQIRLDHGKAWLDGQCWTLYPLTLARGLTACMACDSATETVHIRRLSAPEQR